MEARRIRIEYDFSVTSRSTSVIDRIDTKTKNLNRNTNITRNSISNLSRTVNLSTGSLNGMANATDRVARSSASATSRLKSFSNAMHDLSRNAGFAFRNLFSWRTMFLGFATGNVLGAAKRALIDYNVEMDNFRQGISMSLNQMTDWSRAFGGVTSAQEKWNKSMIGSQAIMNNLRKHAASSIGSVKDYAEAFQLINAQVMAVGGNAGDSLEIAKRLVPLSKASGRDTMTGAMDVNQILRGDPNLRNINLPAFRDPRVIALIKEIRGNPKQGIAGNPANGMRKLIAIMKESDTGIQAYGKTYQAQMETMTDNFQVFAGKVGEPIFDRITKEMSVFNKNFAHTEAALQRSGTLFGKYLVDAFDKGREGLNKFYESLKLVGASIMSITQAMIALRVAGFAAGAASMIGGQSRNHIALPSMPRMRTFNQPLALPPIAGPLAGAGRISPAAAAHGVHMSPWNAGVAGAGAAGAAPAIAQVGMLRSVLGSTMLGFLGLGVAIAATTDRAKSLSKEHGYLGKMAKETVGVMSGLKGAFEMVANVAVGLVGSIAWVSKQLAKFTAVMFGGRVSHGRSFITKSNVEGIATDQNTMRSQLDNQSSLLIDYRTRINDLYSTGIVDKASNELRLWGILGGYKPDNEIGRLIHSGNLEEAYKAASRIAIKQSGIAPKQTGQLPDDMESMNYSMKKGYQNPITTWDSFPMFPEVQAGLIKDGLITAGQIKRTNEIVNREIARRQEYLDRSLSMEEERIAREFLGRQKQDEPPKFDFSGSTIIMNQDFRNSDPDRVFIKFAEDIGVVSANHIQSKLSPIVR